MSSVSTLTQPEGRVQRLKPLLHVGEKERFNPHPARRPGATWKRTGKASPRAYVSTLTQPEGRVQPGSP